MSIIVQHYSSNGVAERILHSYRAAYGADAEVSPERLAPLDQFHTGGLPSTKAMTKALSLRPGLHVLDVGSGIGGPARWIAKNFACRVTGIDFVAEFCDCARQLCKAAGLHDVVEIVEGDALDMPFSAEQFDAAYAQNVTMNIANKRALFSEIFRVLKPSGFAYFSSIGAGEGDPPVYPVPWATTADGSFLESMAATKQDLVEAGFSIISAHDTTSAVVQGLTEARNQPDTTASPMLSTEVLMGPRIVEMRENLFVNLRERRMSVTEVLARKTK